MGQINTKRSQGSRRLAFAGRRPARKLVKITRTEALKKVETNKTKKRPVFVITYDPRLPSITVIVKKHWRTMVRDLYLADVFTEPPLIAYKRPQNIREKIVRAKVPPPAPSWNEQMQRMSNLSIYYTRKEGQSGSLRIHSRDNTTNRLSDKKHSVLYRM